MNFLERIVENINYLGGVALFLIGLHTVVTHSNLIKKIIGLNIMGTGVFLFFIAIGNVEGGVPPIWLEGMSNPLFVNPVPSALILTGIVVSVSVTVYSLSLVIRIFQTYGTIDQKELAEKMAQEVKHD
jgi:multicomponent Na+:H+ antiporter subunit C